jgi:hypothetical protein
MIDRLRVGFRTGICYWYPRLIDEENLIVAPTIDRLRVGICCWYLRLIDEKKFVPQVSISND